MANQQVAEENNTNDENAVDSARGNHHAGQGKNLMIFNSDLYSYKIMSLLNL